MMTPMNFTSLLDPEIARALTQVEMLTQTLSADNLHSIRAARAGAPQAPVSDAVRRTDHVLATRAHASVRMHRGHAAHGLLPAIYWMHGGGLVLGTNRIDDPRFDRWCSALECVGASVEYELAPESQYPGPLEDCYAGLCWLHANAEAFGIDPTRIGIGG